MWILPVGWMPEKMRFIASFRLSCGMWRRRRLCRRVGRRSTARHARGGSRVRGAKLVLAMAMALVLAPAASAQPYDGPPSAWTAYWEVPAFGDHPYKGPAAARGLSRARRRGPGCAARSRAPCLCRCRASARAPRRRACSSFGRVRSVRSFRSARESSTRC